MVIQAQIIRNNSLIPEKDWVAHIQHLREAVGHGSKDAVKRALVAAVRKRIPQQPFGIFFSGGVDSSLIALLCAKEQATCYAVGFQGEGMEMPPDILAARKVASFLGIRLVEKVFTEKEIEPIIKRAISILPKPLIDEIDADYVVKIGVASVVIAAAGLAKEKIFFSGLGSEEIFAGYERHVKADDVNTECWNGLLKMWQRDLVRDAAVGKELGITVLTPFLDPDVIIGAMRIPGDKKIIGEHKKAILREIAEELGLPHEMAWRKKQGAQYGSRFDKALEKLAKMNGFRYRKEYLTSLL